LVCSSFIRPFVSQAGILVFFLSIGLEREGVSFGLEADNEGFIFGFDVVEAEEAILLLEEVDALENLLELTVGELELDRLAKVDRTGIRGP
jgi:hypothetical protein